MGNGFNGYLDVWGAKGNSASGEGLGDDNMGMFNMPMTAGGLGNAGDTLGGINGWLFSSSAPDAAVELLMHYTSIAASADAASGAYIPVVKGADASIENEFLQQGAKNIANSLSGVGYDTVLEIGPGMGVLTKYLLESEAQINVIEIDRDSVAYLNNDFKNEHVNLDTTNAKFKIIEGDFLKKDVPTFFNKKQVAIIGNYPYNISSQIIFKAIENREYIPELSGMFQKEVADRIIADFNTSAYGRLSILTNWRLKIRKICDIGPECFSPRPKIDSSLLYFVPKSNFIEVKNPKNIEIISRVFFNHRRKMLKKPFIQLFNGDKKILDKLKIDLNLRPHNLDFETYYKLAIEYENLRS